MNVIHSTTLLTRRLTDLQRRRDGLLDRQERLRRSLPEWAFAPLQVLGMSSAEIHSMVSDLSAAETEAGLDEIGHELERIDGQIEEIENQLLAMPVHTLDSVSVMLDIALSRFKSQTSSDPQDVLYDYGDARVLAFLERARSDLHGMLAAEQRQAS